MVGYGVIRITLGEEDGWRIGPLFADNSDIARALYQDLVYNACANVSQTVITLEVPYGKHFNQDSLSLVTELGGVPTFKMMRVYTDSVPPSTPTHKIYVMT